MCVCVTGVSGDVYFHADHEAVLFSELSDIWPGSEPKGLRWRVVLWGDVEGGEQGEKGERSGGTIVNCTARICEWTYNGSARKTDRERRGGFKETQILKVKSC